MEETADRAGRQCDIAVCALSPIVSEETPAFPETHFDRKQRRRPHPANGVDDDHLPLLIDEPGAIMEDAMVLKVGKRKGWVTH